MYAYLNWLQNTLNKISHKLKWKNIDYRKSGVKNIFTLTRMFLRTKTWYSIKKRKSLFRKTYIHIFITNSTLQSSSPYSSSSSDDSQTQKEKNNVMMIERFQTSFMSTCLVVFLLHIDMVLLSSVRTNNWFFKV